MGDPETDIDLAKVLAEVDEELRLRRASGDFPVDLDRELDGIFSSLTPEARVGRELETLLERVEETAFVDVDVPTASRIPGGTLVKTVLLRLTGWALQHVTQQTTAFAATAGRTLRLLSQRVDTTVERLDALERGSTTVRARARDEARRSTVRRAARGPAAARGTTAGEAVSGEGGETGADAVAGDAVSGEGGETGAHAVVLDTGWWAELVARRLAGQSGRVLHAEAGDGHLLARLEMIGVDAYGVDPVQEQVEAGARRGLDVRLDEAADHLRVVPDGVLAGLVLTGCVERLAAAELLALADAAARALAPGGVLAIVSSTPEAWGREVAVVEADLTMGRPFHADTWSAVLEARDFDDIAVHPGPAAPQLAPVDPEVPGATAVNANVDLLNATLFGPRAYAVTAVRR